MTWLQVLFEYQRDWARESTAAGVQDILRAHAGALGAGVFYAKSMIPPNSSAASGLRRQEELTTPSSG